MQLYIEWQKAYFPLIAEFIMDGKLVQGKSLGTRLVQPL
jgi:hypothetical protein